MEILNEIFPEEISFNILKFMTHPTAELMKSYETCNACYFEKYKDDDNYCKSCAEIYKIMDIAYEKEQKRIRKKERRQRRLLHDICQYNYH